MTTDYMQPERPGDTAVDLGGPERWLNPEGLSCLIGELDRLAHDERARRVQIGRFCFDTGDAVGRASLRVAVSWLRAQCNSIESAIGDTDPDSRAAATMSASHVAESCPAAGATTDAGQMQTSSGLSSWFCAPVSSAAHAAPKAPLRSPGRRDRLTDRTSPSDR